MNPMFYNCLRLVLNSNVALTVAAFSHVYIWVHFYATEKPDMDYLYNAANNCNPSDAVEPRR